MNNYNEPSDEQIRAVCDARKIDYHRNYWSVREELRNAANGPPPNGFTDWGKYWKSF